MKKKKKLEHENLERWLLTYADLITLLLVFFIVLYSMSSVSKAKFNALSESLAIIFGNVGRSGFLDGGRAVIPGDKTYKERLNMQNTQERVRRMIASMGLQGKITTALEERGLVISIKDTVLFGRGSADLDSRAREVILTVGNILAPMPNAIRVEGHTDNDPIHTERFYSNWELSTARATNVLRLLIQNVGIAPERLSAAGYGQYKPQSPNDSPNNKALNRRVDVVLLANAFSKFEPPAASAEGSARAGAAPGPPSEPNDSLEL